MLASMPKRTDLCCLVACGVSKIAARKELRLGVFMRWKTAGMLHADLFGYSFAWSCS